MPPNQALECGHGVSKYERPACESKHASLPERSHLARSEKPIARKVSDAALKRELQDVTREAKKRGRTGSKEPGDVWDLEQYLTQRLGTWTQSRALLACCLGSPEYSSIDFRPNGFSRPSPIECACWRDSNSARIWSSPASRRYGRAMLVDLLY